MSTHNLFEGLFLENELTTPTPSGRRHLEVGPLECEGGGYLPNVTVSFETWGVLNAERSNAILVCHALTGDSHVVGWWSSLVGPGKAIDTEKYFVIGANVLGGCQGTTGPASLAADGKRFGSRFPVITVRDMVTAQIRLIDHLGISKLLCVAGGSMGGMQALQWTVQVPHRVQKAFISASAAAHSAMQIGFNEAARQAIMRDPAWCNGDYEREGPTNGLAVARMIGHLTFLSEASFAEKFNRRFQDKLSASFHLDVEFEIESYLKYQAEKFTQRFDANTLVILTRAIDYYDLQSLSGATASFLIVSYQSDWLYPSHQAENLLRLATDAGCPATHLNIDLPFGHDCFLLDGTQQGEPLRQFLGDAT